MDNIKVNILNAAEDLFLRIGPGRTNMTQVASAAGVSRQSVYAHFENKETLIAAVAGQIMGKIHDQLHVSWTELTSFEDTLDIFFQLNVIEPFAILQKHPELELLLQGGSARTAKAVQHGEHAIVEALARQIAPHCAHLPKSIAARDLADYITRVSKSMKYSVSSEDELARQLYLLKSSMIALLDQR